MQTIAFQAFVAVIMSLFAVGNWHSESWGWFGFDMFFVGFALSQVLTNGIREAMR